MNAVRLQALHRATPSSRLCWLWSRKGDLQRAWNWDRKAVWDQVGLSHCRHDSLVTVRDEARCRRGYNDQSRWGHQCREMTLTGESLFHISTPWGLNPGPSGWEANGWTTGPVELCMNAVRLQALHSAMIFNIFFLESANVSWKIRLINKNLRMYCCNLCAINMSKAVQTSYFPEDKFKHKVCVSSFLSFLESVQTTGSVFSSSLRFL